MPPTESRISHAYTNGARSPAGHGVQPPNILQHNTFNPQHPPRCRADNRHYVK